MLRESLVLLYMSDNRYFTTPVFYINESTINYTPSLDNIKSYCTTYDTTSTKGSRISITDASYTSLNLPSTTTTIGPMNLFGLQQYVLTATTELLADIKLAEMVELMMLTMRKIFRRFLR